MYNRVGVIGDIDSVSMFKAAGLEVFDAPDVSAARDVLKKLTKENFAVIFITEEYAKENEDILLQLKTQSFPAVIPIPTALGSTGYGLQGVKKDIEKALGAEVLV